MALVKRGHEIVCQYARTSKFCHDRMLKAEDSRWRNFWHKAILDNDNRALKQISKSIPRLKAEGFKR